MEGVVRQWPPVPEPACGEDFDALVDLEPGGLSEEDLRRALLRADRLRARLDGVAAALVGVFDGRCVWAADGAKSAPGWLAARTQVSRAACGAEVRVARALREMPATEVAAREGRLSRDKVRALVWARQPGLEEAFAVCEEQLVVEVEAPTVAGAWRYVRRWVLDMRTRLGLNEPDGPEPGDGQGRSRVSLATGLEGRWFGSLDLTAEDGEVVAGAVEAQVQAMWDHRVFTADDGLSMPERRAAALVEVVTRGTRGGDEDSTARPLILGLIDLDTLTGRHGAEARPGPCDRCAHPPGSTPEPSPGAGPGETTGGHHDSASGRTSGRMPAGTSPAEATGRGAGETPEHGLGPTGGRPDRAAGPAGGASVPDRAPLGTDTRAGPTDPDPDSTGPAGGGLVPDRAPPEPDRCSDPSDPDPDSTGPAGGGSVPDRALPGTDARAAPTSSPDPDPDALSDDDGPLFSVCPVGLGGQRGGPHGHCDTANSVIMQLSELSGAGPVPPEALRRLACEGDVIPVIVDTDGTPLDMGRRVRLATRAQRRALRIRDGHCTFAGCTTPPSTASPTTSSPGTTAAPPT